MSDGPDREPASAEDEGAYCRVIEAHLCRRNQGHVVRLVGPSFERVRGWAARGIPLKLAIQGVDRYVDRAEAKGPRRRPIRAEFCEADVLDVFDEWRRALGLSSSLLARPGEAGTEEEAGADEGARGRRSLRKHLERTLASLNGIPGRSDVPPALASRVTDAIAAIGELVGRHRGAGREDVVSRLAAMDAALMAAAREAIAPDDLRALAEEARTEIEPFRARMAAAPYAGALAAATDRLIRRHFRLPILTFE